VRPGYLSFGQIADKFCRVAHLGEEAVAEDEAVGSVQSEQTIRRFPKRIRGLRITIMNWAWSRMQTEKNFGEP